MRSGKKQSNAVADAVQSRLPNSVGRLLDQVFEEYYQEGVLNENGQAYMKLKKKCEKNDFNLEMIAKGNNIVLKINSNKNAARDVAVVQMGEKSAASVKAQEILESLSVRPVWLPESYANNVKIVFDNKHDMEADKIVAIPTDKRRNITVMEYFNTRFADWAKKRAETGNVQVIAIAAAKIASQMAQVFSIMKTNNIIWTDVKPGNISLQISDSGDVRIGLHDPKGFIRIDDIGTYKATNYDVSPPVKGEYIKFPDLTMNFLSPNAQETFPFIEATKRS